ncbi:MAG: phosphoglucosamine mutase [Planctomycetaceae bacterium]|mgnify:CR=1 FL=1|nr:phosphoglucosamine mutase [Planctomycetaceae bacterium]
MAELIISVSGLRGIVGETLTPEVAIRYVTAFSAGTPGGPFVVTRDGRATGNMVSEAVMAGLHAVGRNTIDGGIAATPTTGVLVRRARAAGGIQISASHNPPQYNGLKLFSAEGRVIPAEPGRAVLARYQNGEADWVTYERLGENLPVEDPHADHLQAVLATVDAEAIRARRFKVLLCSNHGAGSLLGERLLKALGCKVTVIGGKPDGQFEYTPEPTAENLVSVLPKVRQLGVDVGFCQDPDADRLALIDADGRYVGEEYTLAICANHVLASRKGPVVANCATSRMTEDIAKKYGVPYHRAAVGEANVVDCMLANRAVFGGEGNGGPIDPNVGLVRDSFVGMAQVLAAMASRQVALAQLADELPRYEIVKTKINLSSDKVSPAVEALTRRFPNAQADRMDGLRLDWPDRWLLVRPSNTEPIVRAIAEAPDLVSAETLCRQAAEVLATV